MSLKRTLLAATITSSMSGVVAAQPLNGLYVGAGAGVNWLQNEHLVNASGTAANAALQSHFGWVAVGSVGYALPNGLRFEIEGDFRNNQFAHGRDFGFPARAGGRELKGTARCSTCCTT